jgi:hypothetical protein
MSDDEINMLSAQQINALNVDEIAYIMKRK